MVRALREEDGLAPPGTGGGGPLVAGDLTDELRLTVHPLGVSRAERLFVGGDRRRVTLAGARMFPDGVVRTGERADHRLAA